MKKQGVFASVMACIQRGLWWAYGTAYTAQEKEVRHPQGLIHFIWMVGVGAWLRLVYKVSWVYILSIVVLCLAILKGLDVSLLISNDVYIYHTGLALMYADIFCLVLALLVLIGKCYRLGEWANDFLIRHIWFVYSFIGTLAVLLIGDSLYRGVLAQEVYQFLWSFLDGMGVFLGVIIFAGTVVIEWLVIALLASMSGYIGVWLYQKLPDAKKQYFKKSIRFLCSLLQKATIRIYPPHREK